jgi:hypothetical protein
MAANMRTALLRIHLVDLTRPLASQEPGGEVYEVATTMLTDIEGWAQLFGVKVVETGRKLGGSASEDRLVLQPYIGGGGTACGG